MTPNSAFVALALVLASAAIATRSEAYTPDATILARTLIAESGPRLVADHPAILHVLERRAARVGSTAAEVALRYSPVHRAPQGQWGRSVQHASLLELSETAPAVVELVVAWQRGDKAADPCRGRAEHWGQPIGEDLSRALRAGWRRVNCGMTANAFWEVPR